MVLDTKPTATSVKQAQKQLSHQLRQNTQQFETFKAHKAQLQQVATAQQVALLDKERLSAQLDALQAEHELLQQQNADRVAGLEAQLRAQAGGIQQCKGAGSRGVGALEEDESALQKCSHSWKQPC